MEGTSIDKLVDFGSPQDYDRLDLPPPEVDGEGLARLSSSTLRELAGRAFTEIAFRLPPEQARDLGAIASRSGPSEADRFVACELLRNAAIAAEGVLPLCQDTGTALVYGWKGSLVFTDGEDEAALAEGARAAYVGRRLRASQLAPLGFLAERNTGDNLPIAADIRIAGGASRAREYRLCFSAKGGGSANRTSLSMESPSILEPRLLEAKLKDRITSLGASGCPPYRLAAVLGGQAPDEALRVLSLATLGLLDRLPDCAASGAAEESALRDTDWEGALMRLAAASGIGAQFGGSCLALSARAIRLSRHAASLPLAFGVACSAHRRARAIISPEGVLLERMEADPGRYLPASLPILPGARRVDLDRPMSELGLELGSLEPGAFLLLSGTVVVARDAAHARFRFLVESGASLPDYLKCHPVFYAGPTEAAPGAVSGSFGPTTSGRMDAYMSMLTSRGACLVSIAKGGRSAEAAAAIGEAGGAYLACIGGAAALAAREHIERMEIIDYPELGMEAVRLAVLKELPAMLVVDGRGRDFYALLKRDAR